MHKRVGWKWPLISAVTVAGLAAVVTAVQTRWHVYVLWLVCAGATTTLLYAIDKLAARRNWRRIPEPSLWTLIALGGFLGGWIGQFALRHKTRKWRFWLVLVLSTILHGAIAWFIWHHTGFR